MEWISDIWNSVEAVKASFEAVEATVEAVDAVGGLVDAVEAAGGIYRAVEDLPRDGYPDASSDHQSAWNIVAHVPMRFFRGGGGSGL